MAASNSMTEDEQFAVRFHDIHPDEVRDCGILVGWLREENIKADTRTVAKFWMWRSELWCASWLIVSGSDRKPLLKYWREWETEGRELHSLN